MKIKKVFIDEDYIFRDEDGNLCGNTENTINGIRLNSLIKFKTNIRIGIYRYFNRTINGISLMIFKEDDKNLYMSRLS